jgi:hypothetical protein
LNESSPSEVAPARFFAIRSSYYESPAIVFCVPTGFLPNKYIPLRLPTRACRVAPTGGPATRKEPDTGSRIPSISTGGAATQAMMNTHVAVNKHGIINTPNQPMYKRFSVFCYGIFPIIFRCQGFKKLICVVSFAISGIFHEDGKKY